MISRITSGSWEMFRNTAATFCGTCSRASTQPNRLAPATMSPTTADVLTDSLKMRGRSRQDISR